MSDVCSYQSLTELVAAKNAFCAAVLEYDEAVVPLRCIRITAMRIGCAVAAAAGVALEIDDGAKPVVVSLFDYPNVRLDSGAAAVIGCRP